MADELRDFVKNSLGAGLAREDIRKVLRSNGWSPNEIDAVLEAFGQEPGFPPVPKPRISFAKDAFLSLVTFVFLGWLCYSLGSLGFSLVDLYLRPHPPGTGWDPSWATRDIRIDIAYLLIALPAWLALTVSWHRAAESDPDKKSSPVRRWLTSLTLVVAATAAIGDVMVIARGLALQEGHWTDLLQGLIVLTISSAVFFFYRTVLQRTDTGR